MAPNREIENAPLLRAWFWIELFSYEIYAALITTQLIKACTIESVLQ